MKERKEGKGGIRRLDRAVVKQWGIDLTTQTDRLLLDSILLLVAGTRLEHRECQVLVSISDEWLRVYTIGQSGIAAFDGA